MKTSFLYIRNFFLGTLILIPLSFFIRNTEVFYVQTVLMIFQIALLVLDKKTIPKTIGRGSLVFDVSFYIGWVLVSFLLNFFFSFDILEAQGRRVISMGIALLLMSGFFVGRNLGGTHTNGMMNGIFFTYLFVLGYIAFVFLSQPNLDLYVVRRVIEQRLPFVIAFVSTLAAVYFFHGKPKKFYYLFIATAGVLAVVFSLTRAAYIQLFISFFILFINEIRKYFFRGILIVGLLIVTSALFYQLFREFSAVKQISSRVELLFDIKAQSNSDESGSLRVEMWNFLLNKLLDDPLRLIIGYGQLGPTYVAKDFVSSYGISGNNAHNQYLDVVVREGLVGLFFLLWLCYKSLRLGFSMAGTSDEATLFVKANSIALAGVMFYGFFHETFRYPLFGFYFWLYLGVLSKISEKR